LIIRKVRIYILSILLFLATFSYCALGVSSMHQNQEHSIKTLGVVIFPDFELLDVFGPLEMFGHLPNNIKIILIAEKEGAVPSYQGPSVLVDATLEDAPDIDLLFIPGGLGTRKEVNNKKLIHWIKERSAKAEMILSVCTGAALLAQAGVLDNKSATTNKIAFNWVAEQGPKVKWVKKARWVEDGNIVTSSGVTAGTDMSLYVISSLYGKEIALSVANTTEYTWHSDPTNDPFSKNL